MLSQTGREFVLEGITIEELAKKLDRHTGADIEQLITMEIKYIIRDENPVVSEEPLVVTKQHIENAMLKLGPPVSDEVCTLQVLLSST